MFLWVWMSFSTFLCSGTKLSVAHYDQLYVLKQSHGNEIDIVTTQVQRKHVYTLRQALLLDDPYSCRQRLLKWVLLTMSLTFLLVWDSCSFLFFPQTHIASCPLICSCVNCLNLLTWMYSFWAPIKEWMCWSREGWPCGAMTTQKKIVLMRFLSC
jgi:hypothetical protein